MSSNQRIIKKQTFQNAQHTVEVLVKAKPKPKLGLKTKYKPKSTNFVRDCLLKKELEKMSLEAEGNSNKQHLASTRATSGAPKNHDIPKKTLKHKIKSPKQYGDERRKKKQKEKFVLPPNTTWREFLESFSSTSVVSESQSSFCESSISSSQSSSQLSQDQLHQPNRNLRKFRESPASDVHFYGQWNRNAPEIDHPTRPKPSQDRSIQTSFRPTAESQGVYQVDSGVRKGVPRPIHISEASNMGKSSVDQTHSPFGQSALRLLHQLRERLQSLGDNEGSELVSAIEAYFGTSDQKSNKDARDVGPAESPMFPSVFAAPTATAQRDDEKEAMKRVMEKQEKKLREQEETIQELRSLSERMLAYHEQLTEQVIQDGRAPPIDKKAEAAPKGRGKVDHDSGVEVSSSEDLQKTVKLLTSERDALLKEVKSQREVILDLEVKLNRSMKGITENRKSNSDASSRPSSRNSQAQYNDFGGVYPKLSSEPEKKQPLYPHHTYLLRHTPNESDADSAYDEKSSKGSRAPSKISSHLNGNEHRSKQDAEGHNSVRNGTQPILRNFEQEERLTPVQVASDIVASRKSDRDSTYAPHFQSLNQRVNRLTNYERPDNPGNPLILPHQELSLTLISDISTEDPNFFTITERHDPSRESGTLSEPHKAFFYDTPLIAASERYLESTHVNERDKSSSPSKTRRQQRFQPQLSSFEPSDNQTELVPESCSSNLEDLSYTLGR